MSHIQKKINIKILIRKNVISNPNRGIIRGHPVCLTVPKIIYYFNLRQIDFLDITMKNVTKFMLFPHPNSLFIYITMHTIIGFIISKQINFNPA